MSGMAGEKHMPPHERELILADVEQCDKETEAARQGGEAKQQKLLECLEKALHHRRRLYTEAAPEVAQACRSLCEACNFIATRMLQQDNMKAAHDLLKRAEQVADKHDMDRATTWNNLACYYRRQGKLRTAVTFLERALQIEEHTGSSDAAQSHLNICATLSQLGRHADALYHAQSALIRIYEILSPLMLRGELGADGRAPPERQEQLTVLCIAYHNLAVEQEYLQNYDAAASAYAEGVRWATKFLGDGHQLGGIMRNSMDAVKGKLPKGSGALRRWDELTCGDFNGNAKQEPSGPSGAETMLQENLLTPRHPAPPEAAAEEGGGEEGEGEADAAPQSPSGPAAN